MDAIAPDHASTDDFALADALAGLCGAAIPKAVTEIRNAPVLHDNLCEKEEMADMVCRFLGIKD